MKSLLTWTERRPLQLSRKLYTRQNFHFKAEMFSFHIGVWAGGVARGALPLSNFGQLRFFGRQKKFGQTSFQRSLHVSFLLFRRDGYFLF